jgi:hypothetical protein
MSEQLFDRIPSPVSEDTQTTLREEIKEQLTAIAAAVQVALRETDLAYPVFFSIPSSGRAILTYATPCDPCDADWQRMSAIVCGIVSEAIDVEGLQGRELPCAVATGTMGAADLLVASPNAGSAQTPKATG